MSPPAYQSQRSPSPSQPSGKSEVTDLKLQLRQLAGSRAPGTDDSKRDLFKKVISYMTIGIDVSSVFSEMVMCSATSDIVLKKMCYLYVGNYARNNPDLALLTINFLQRDCKDQDPMIRGLALRSLCTLRVANLVEYLVGPLVSGLKDGSSYVRTVAAIGVLKLYHISVVTCIDAEFPAMLKHLMLNDPDSQVVANCLSALQEIWSAEASTSEEASRERDALLSKTIIYFFLNRIRDFSEWAQCLVLELVAKYVPSDNSEVFDIMNLLEDRLQHANGAVVLATIKVFMHLTLSMTDVHQQVYERIKAPLITLMSTGSPELSYAVLSHLHLLVMRAPMLFTSDYKHFYCHYNEPPYVKKLKLDMLTAVANEDNTFEIVTELCEYVANVDIPIARESIRAVGKIALQQYDVNAIVDRLLQFLEMEKDHVTAETLVLIKDLLRKYPQWSHDCIAVVGNISSKNVQEPKAKAALIWMLGEYAQDMADAPYTLESFIENWEEEDSAEIHWRFLFGSNTLANLSSLSHSSPPSPALIASLLPHHPHSLPITSFNNPSADLHRPLFLSPATLSRPHLSLRYHLLCIAQPSDILIPIMTHTRVNMLTVPSLPSSHVSAPAISSFFLPVAEGGSLGGDSLVGDDSMQVVRLHLLTAAMKCFFRRAPETQKALGAALAAGVADFHQDVHDRALLYYRLLQHGISVAEEMVNPPKQAVSVFADIQSSEIKDRIFDEFNSLSVVYQKPSYMFTDKEHRGPFEFSDELGNLSIGAESLDNVVPAQRVEANDKDLLLSTEEKEYIRVPTNNGSIYSAPVYDAISGPLVAVDTQPVVQSPQTSMAIDDLLGLSIVPTAVSAPTPSPPSLQLNSKAVLDPGTFQQKWRQLPISTSQGVVGSPHSSGAWYLFTCVLDSLCELALYIYVKQKVNISLELFIWGFVQDIQLTPQGVAALTTPQSLLRHMQGNSIHCIASGGQSPNFKYFFFAQKAEDTSTFLVECIINTSSCKAQIKIKADDQSPTKAFSDMFQAALSKFGMP
ncbi:hypothetical protein KSS87_009477 [Heliosperma pusillum]|nr:hypothetical protein KSS87_000308 [Heliosperma pusillum]KAH9622489.1 hypothetical protein KSS87_009477 [Heliosperma pusillum]